MRRTITILAIFFVAVAITALPMLLQPVLLATHTPGVVATVTPTLTPTATVAIIRIDANLSDYIGAEIVRRVSTGVAWGFLNVRECGSTSCAVLATLEEGAPVRVVRCEVNGWCMIDQPRGWCYGAYLLGVSP